MIYVPPPGDGLFFSLSLMTRKTKNLNLEIRCAKINPKIFNSEGAPKLIGLKISDFSADELCENLSAQKFLQGDPPNLRSGEDSEYSVSEKPPYFGAGEEYEYTSQDPHVVDAAGSGKRLDRM